MTDQETSLQNLYGSLKTSNSSTASYMRMNMENIRSARNTDMKTACEPQQYLTMAFDTSVSGEDVSFASVAMFSKLQDIVLDGSSFNGAQVCSSAFAETGGHEVKYILTDTCTSFSLYDYRDVIDCSMFTKCTDINIITPEFTFQNFFRDVFYKLGDLSGLRWLALNRGGGAIQRTHSSPG